mmetsp:Transcript_94547/g.273327  ORF Transcript_94547/g.273327 Transcript_94547/m.273327 type:complete len:482 (-) Transcript_94547:244-1689(-)
MADFDDANAPPWMKDSRGWSMRHGHCKRLCRDSGRESTRGRAVFARSMRGGQCAPECNERARAQRGAFRRMKECLRGDRIVLGLREDATILPYASGDFNDRFRDVNDDDDDVAEQQMSSAVAPTADLLGRLAKVKTGGGGSEASTGVSSTGSDADAPSPPPSLRRCRSMPCTARELEGSRRQVAIAQIALGAWRPAMMLRGLVARRLRAPRWEAAIARAKACPMLSGIAAAGRRRKADAGIAQADQAFAEVRQRFIAQHGETILKELRKVFTGPVRLEPAPLNMAVQKNFANACAMHASVALTPVLHGTDARNHSSIFEKGLLIPGGSDAVSVRNGNSHGQGIYTSKLDAAWLSQGFCTEPRMLVCGVLDDAAPVPRRLLGRHWVTAESKSTRHVGSAIVVFDPSRVAPLFEAVGVPMPTVSAPIAAPARALAQMSPSPGPATAGPATADVVRAKRPQRRPGPQLSAVVAFLARRAAAKRR